MADMRDLFDENLERLLEKAEQPPTMDRARRERARMELRSAFVEKSRVEAEGRKSAMRRWIVGGACALAAAAAIVVLSLTGDPGDSGDAPAGRRIDGLAADVPVDFAPAVPREVETAPVRLQSDLAAEAGGAVKASLVTSDKLGGPQRYRTHLSTDKPVYRLGETVYVRGVILDASDSTPLGLNRSDSARLEIRGPKGEAVAASSAAAQDSVVGFSWKIPDGQPGGQYTVKVSYPWEGHAPAERTFDVRAYRPPRLKSQIVFVRKGYGPGDTAAATLHVERAEGGVPVGADVIATARVDGVEVAREVVILDNEGNCSVSFELPREIARGEGSIAMTIEDGGVVETAAKTIPILLQTMDIEMYPEGGELVVGLPCRVYLEARTPSKKPADIAGVVVDSSGAEVARFRTEHEGRGRFVFTPELDEKYVLKVAEPAGISTNYPLPVPNPVGVVITSPVDVTPAGESVRLGVGVTVERVISVTLSKNEREVSGARLKVRPGGLAEVVLTPPSDAAGVLVATVWDGEGKALAERLVYREPARSLNVEVSTAGDRYVPGGTAELTVRTTDADGRPVSAVVGLAVTDDSVLEMIDKREQAPRLPVMVLLEDEVRELADAHVYLDRENPYAPQALDLLLGTQGWRRFAYVDPGRLIAEHGEDATRLVAMRTRPSSDMGWRGIEEGDRAEKDRFAEVRLKDFERERGDEKARINVRPGKSGKPVIVHEEAKMFSHFAMDVNVARGQEDAISDIPLGGVGVVGNIGVGGGGAGCFGFRTGGGRRRAALRGGGSRQSELTVDAALRWLARHQCADGHWDGEAKYEPTDPGENTDPGVTGLAALAFLGAGHTEKTGKFRDNVTRAVAWLRRNQAADGSIGRNYAGGLGYHHAIAGMALAEAYGMARVSATGRAAQKAIDYAVHLHQADYSGWRYEPKSPADMSVTGWFIMQLKSAIVAGLRVDAKGFQGAAAFLDHCTKRGGQIGQVSYQPGRPATHSMTAIGMLSRQFMGWKRNDPLLVGGANYLLGSLPEWKQGEVNFYYWYHGTLAMFQMDEPWWKQWNAAMRDMLIERQRDGAPEIDGSWDPQGTWNATGGRVYSTALGALCLEVYYRYLPLYRAGPIQPARNPAAAPSLVPVRVYAHKARPNRAPNDRVDFAETLYWNAGIRTDAETGEAKVSFDLCDSVTTFRVFADGFSADGALGASTGGVESVEPFYLEPKLPLEVAAGDVIELPVSFVNSTSDDQLDVSRLEVLLGGRLLATPDAGTALAPSERVRQVVTIDVGSELGECELVVRAKAEPFSDEVRRKLVVKPAGYPVEVSFGGVAKPDGAVRHVIEIPDDVIRGSLSTETAMHPTPLANMTESLKRLMREPNGCFEQTSSTTYPLVMAQQYFISHQGVDPSIIEKSQSLLEKGYRKLTGFECRNRGYEWFGADPGHEALTAFGLLEFTDMAAVRDVDRAMIERTRKWLLRRRDGKGGFTSERRALHTWRKDPALSNAYVTWALLESGETDLGREVAWVKDAADESSNSYVCALGANVMFLAGERGAATKLMTTLAGKQTEGGWIDGATVSVVGSGGMALKIETTSLAALAWMRDGGYSANVERAMKYLAESCSNGSYGSTQSTVLALRAIVEYDKLHAGSPKNGSVQVLVDGRPVAEPLGFGAKTQGAITLPDFGDSLTPGWHTVELVMVGGTAMPYSLAIIYSSATPESSEECKVALSTALTDEQVDEGTLTEANVVVENLTDDGLPMTMAIVGVPGGLEPRHDHLKELVNSGAIAAYEVMGRDVVLYWREMGPRERKELAIQLLAAVPGEYTAPASRAYLYYTDEDKHWVSGLHVKIIAGAEAPAF